MPATHVALLRGINVGRAKRVAMADLRALVEGLGYRDVKTLLNSGNVVFTAKPGGPDPAPRIEAALLKRLGIASRVTVLETVELEAAVRENTLGPAASDPSRLLAVILTRPADRALLLPLAKQAWAPEALALGTRVAFVWCPDGILESRLLESVGRALGDAQTARNWTTLTKLLALAGAAGAPGIGQAAEARGPSRRAVRPSRASAAGRSRTTRRARR